MHDVVPGTETCIVCYCDNLIGSRPVPLSEMGSNTRVFQRLDGPAPSIGSFASPQASSSRVGESSKFGKYGHSMFVVSDWGHGASDGKLSTGDADITMDEPNDSIWRSASEVQDQSAVSNVRRHEPEEVNVAADPAGSYNRIISNIEHISRPPSPSPSSRSEEKEEEDIVRALLLADDSRIASPSLSEPQITFPDTPAFDGRVLSHDVSEPRFQPPAVQWPPVDLYQRGVPPLTFSPHLSAGAPSSLAGGLEKEIELEIEGDSRTSEQAPTSDATLSTASSHIVSNSEVAARDSRRLETSSDISTSLIVHTAEIDEGAEEEVPGPVDERELSTPDDGMRPFSEAQVNYIEKAVREAVERHAQTSAPKRNIDEVESATESDPGWFLRDLYFVPS